MEDYQYLTQLEDSQVTKKQKKEKVKVNSKQNNTEIEFLEYMLMPT